MFDDDKKKSFVDIEFYQTSEVLFMENFVGIRKKHLLY